MSYQGHTGSANMLVIRLTNVHYEADENFIKDFFQGYKILDQARTENPRTKTRSTVYIMVASVQDRISAVNNLNGGRICGRKVNVMPAHSGNYKINDTHDGFIHEDETAVASEEPSPANVNFSESEFPALGTRSTPRTKIAPPATSAQQSQVPFNNVSKDVLNRLTSPTLPPTLSSPHTRKPSDVRHAPISEKPSSIAAILDTTFLTPFPTHPLDHQAHRDQSPAPPAQTTPKPRHAPTWLWNATPSTLYHHFTSTQSGPQPAAPNTGFSEIVDMPRIPTFPPDRHQHQRLSGIPRLPPPNVDTSIPAVDWQLDLYYDADGDLDEARGIVSEEAWVRFGQIRRRGGRLGEGDGDGMQEGE